MRILNQSIRMLVIAGCSAWLGCSAPLSEASILIGGTRVVYDEDQTEVTLKLVNEGDEPALIQSWIDAGDLHDIPSNAETPFIITPPIMRLGPSRSQSLRIVHTGEGLPQDRESVFWLNVLEVPPKPAADANQLQLAVRSRIKLFYRPAHLKGLAEVAPAALTWRLTRIDGLPAVQAHNPTPFNVSLTEIRVTAGGNTAHFGEGGMVGPGATLAFPFKDGSVASGETPATVHYRSLDDIGAPVDSEAPLQTRAD
ncbi:fimbria/pilus periplasmic chaperone [Achromobacter sp. Bel]|uniref:fimbrial biogenesis chaperone n=1 Tax=Achromobacter sp. Bel TaxID=2727415 RepID=UPI00200717F6|nr:fimbria/pilus periplasmic chaperone [Achromobacter sp. Bel]